MQAFRESSILSTSTIHEVIMKKKKETVEKGNHLTVTVSPSGNVKMEWDWDALLKEVQKAANLVTVTEAKVRKSRKKRV